MPKRILLAVLAGVLSAAGAYAQTAPAEDTLLAGSAVYSAPGFQDFIEAAGGRPNPRGRIGPAGDFRDAPAAAGRFLPETGVVPAPRKAVRAAPLFRPSQGAAGKYVFVTIIPRTRNYSGLVEELSASAGFLLFGERASYSGKAKKTRIMGWARADALSLIHKNPGVARVWIGKEAPAKTPSDRVR